MQPWRLKTSNQHRSNSAQTFSDHAKDPQLNFLAKRKKHYVNYQNCL